MTPSRRFAWPCENTGQSQVSGCALRFGSKRKETHQRSRTRILEPLPDFVTHPGEDIIVDTLVDDEILVAHEERNVVRLPDDVLLVPEGEGRVISVRGVVVQHGKGELRR